MAKKVAKKAAPKKDLINPDARPGTVKSIKLTVPITTGGEEIYFLDFRKPRTADLRKYGMPAQIVISGGEQIVRFDMNITALYVERLCGLAKDDANKLDIDDFMKAQNQVMVFFPTV